MEWAAWIIDALTLTLHTASSGSERLPAKRTGRLPGSTCRPPCGRRTGGQADGSTTVAWGCASRIENSRAEAQHSATLLDAVRLSYADAQMSNLLLALLHFAVLA